MVRKKVFKPEHAKGVNEKQKEIERINKGIRAFDEIIKGIISVLNKKGNKERK